MDGGGPCTPCGRSDRGRRCRPTGFRVVAAALGVRLGPPQFVAVRYDAELRPGGYALDDGEQQVVGPQAVRGDVLGELVDDLGAEFEAAESWSLG